MWNFIISNEGAKEILSFFFFLCINFLFWKRKSKVHWLLKLYTCTYIYRYRHRFPGCPVVRTPCSHCRGPGFNPLVGEQRSFNVLSAEKKKERKKTSILKSALLWIKKKKKNNLKIFQPRHNFKRVQLQNVLLHFPLKKG